MALVNQWGQPIRYKAARGADNSSRDRPFEPVELRDIGKLVPDHDRKTLLSACRRLFLNLGPARGAIEQKAMYSVGRSWSPDFRGSDTEFGKLASDWLENQWYGIGDVRGGMFDFRTALFLISVGIDRDGEAFVLLTQTKDGYPRYQLIPAHRIGSSWGDRDSEVIDGIEYHPSGAPKFYHLLDDDGRLAEKIPAQNIIHLFDPSWQEQGRGLPAFTHAVNDLRDMLQSHEWERMAQLMLSSIGIIETNEAGAPNDDNASILTRDTDKSGDCGRGLTVERLDGGSIRYMKAGTGSKIETIKSDRPGEAWSEFHDRIIRSALCGINWPYSMVWKATGQGTAERSELGKAQRAVEDRQDLLEYAARRLVSYAVAKAQKLEILPPSPDWWRWKFSYPSKITIDDGRVAKELESMWKIGVRNHSDILGMLGKDLEAHYEERAREIYMRRKAAERWSIDGVVIEDRDMCMLTPTEQPNQQQPESNSNDGNDEANS